MTDGAVKSSNPGRVYLSVSFLAGIIYCALAFLGRFPLTPDICFGGGAYLQDGLLQSLLFIQIPVLVNLIILDWTMQYLTTSPIVIRYGTRRRWASVFLLSTSRNAAILYLMQYGVLAVSSALQGKMFDGWTVTALSTLICNIGALTLCCCYAIIAEQFISRASWYFLLSASLWAVCMLPETGGWAGVRLVLPVSYFHFDLVSAPLGIGAALGGLAAHLGIAVLLFNLQTRQIDFLR